MSPQSSEAPFTCRECGREFTVGAEILARYPGWKPAQCWPCKKKSGAGGKSTPSKGAGAKSARGKAKARRKPGSKRREENLTTAQVLEKYTEGPFDGVFTDGACTGNPGPGGWGMVHVRDDEVVAEDCGHDPDTTNNRMELQAIIAALELLPEDSTETIYTDSNLCVNTLEQWAAGWQRRGWKRKDGPVKNLDLVKRAYELRQRHPKVRLEWIKAHAGSRWNEYADSLATSYSRAER